MVANSSLEGREKAQAARAVDKKTVERARIIASAERNVALAPPLTPEQVDRLRVLLSGRA